MSEPIDRDRTSGRPFSRAEYDFFVPTQDRQLRLGAKTLDSVRGRDSFLSVKDMSGEYYSNLTLTIQPGATTVVIGDNVRARREIIADLADLDHKRESGAEVKASKGLDIEFVSPGLTDQIDGSMTLRDFFMSARGIDGYEQALEELYQTVVDKEGGPEAEEAMKMAGELQNHFEKVGGYGAENDISTLIEGLRIASSDHDNITLGTKLGDMSSGQISKAIIGRALYSQANIIIMDDPAVHLDVRSKRWLSDYIGQSGQSMVIATSDMDFAGLVGDRVVEVLDSKLTLNIGAGMDTYAVERERMITYWVNEARQKKEDIDRQREHIKNFLAPAAKQTDNMAQVLRAAKTQLKQAEKEYDNMPGKLLLELAPRNEKKRRFEVGSPSGEDVFMADHLEMMYVSDDADGTVVEVPELKIYNGDRLAIVGSNGSGKSTLMRVLAGSVAEDEMLVEGRLRTGPSAEIGFFSPITELPDEDQPLRLILGRTDPSAMSTLAYWGFDKNIDYDTKPADLREKDEVARAKLAILMAQKPNVLLLDEPTSYLTPSYREKLVDALRYYEGTLVVISHDPDFLTKLGLKGRIVMPGGKRQNMAESIR